MKTKSKLLCTLSELFRILHKEYITIVLDTLLHKWQDMPGHSVEESRQQKITILVEGLLSPTTKYPYNST